MKNTRFILVLVVTFFIISAGIVMADSEYKITLEDGFDTPNREASVEGNTFTVRGVAGVDAGETITADVTVPEEMDFRVSVRGTLNGDRVIMDSESVSNSGGTTISFDTSGYEPGTYTVALRADGDYQAVYPFVVRGLETDLSVPDSVVKGDELIVDASLSNIDSDVEPTGVEIVLTGNGTSTRIDATEDDGTYTATFQTDSLEIADYQVYAATKNDSETPTGDPELVGLSSPQTVSVTNGTTEDTATPSDDGTTGAPGAGGGGQTTVAGTTSSPTTSTVTDSANNSTITATSGPPTAALSETTSGSHDSVASETTSANPRSTTSTSDDILTPNSNTPTDSPGTATSTPGFTILLTILVLVSLLLVVRH